jgi:transposase
MKRISDSKRAAIENLLKKGISSRKIASTQGISARTVRRIKDSLGIVSRNPKPGRPRKLSDTTKRFIRRTILSGKVDTASDMVKYLRNEGLANVSSDTVRRVLKEMGLVARIKVKKKTKVVNPS